MQRTAQCSCGSVKVAAEGDPSAVVACHCLECQRRTGSVLGVGAYFLEERLTLSGDTVQFARATESGLPFVTHFCPTCGTSVYWRAGKIPGLVGVAVGAFADSAFPPPLRSVWEQSRHAWIDVAAAQQHFPRGRP